MKEKILLGNNFLQHMAKHKNILMILIMEKQLQTVMLDNKLFQILLKI